MYVHVHICIYVYIYMYICMYVHIFIYVYISTCVCGYFLDFVLQDITMYNVQIDIPFVCLSQPAASAAAAASGCSVCV